MDLPRQSRLSIKDILLPHPERLAKKGPVMIQSRPVDILFLHVPKFKNWYRPIDHFSFILYHPIGLLGLADYARQNGFSSRIIDLGIEHGKNGPIDYGALVSRHCPLLNAITLHWHFQAFDAIEC